MNEQEFKNKIEERWGHRRYNRNRGRLGLGLFLIIVGGLLLARATRAVIFPAWVFTWPMILIGIGLFSGIRHNFRGVGWLIPIFIGGIFLADRLSPDLKIRPYIWPVVLITLGLVFLLRPKKNCRRFRDGGDDDTRRLKEDTPITHDAPNYKAEWQQAMNEGSDVIDATAIFGGVKKNVLSKNFKGGDITTFMGGAEINLMQADYNGRAMIDCFNMFGGTKLIIPPDWDVQSGVTTIFGGIEDKRPPASVANREKVLILDGTCIFGGIEIKSF